MNDAIIFHLSFDISHLAIVLKLFRVRSCDFVWIVLIHGAKQTIRERTRITEIEIQKMAK